LREPDPVRRSDQRAEVSHDSHFLAALSNRVLELTPRERISTAAAIRNMSPARAKKRRGCTREVSGNFRHAAWREQEKDLGTSHVGFRVIYGREV
jgi:ATPase subunit of ABC transporter with duplicated ATPase domains